MDESQVTINKITCLTGALGTLNALNEKHGNAIDQITNKIVELAREL